MIKQGVVYNWARVRGLIDKGRLFGRAKLGQRILPSAKCCRQLSNDEIAIAAMAARRGGWLWVALSSPGA